MLEDRRGGKQQWQLCLCRGFFCCFIMFGNFNCTFIGVLWLWWFDWKFCWVLQNPKKAKGRTFQERACFYKGGVLQIRIRVGPVSEGQGRPRYIILYICTGPVFDVYVFIFFHLPVLGLSNFAWNRQTVGRRWRKIQPKHYGLLMF